MKRSRSSSCSPQDDTDAVPKLAMEIHRRPICRAPSPLCGHTAYLSCPNCFPEPTGKLQRFRTRRTTASKEKSLSMSSNQSKGSAQTLPDLSTASSDECPTVSWSSPTQAWSCVTQEELRRLPPRFVPPPVDGSTRPWRFIGDLQDQVKADDAVKLTRTSTPYIHVPRGVPFGSMGTSTSPPSFSMIITGEFGTNSCYSSLTAIPCGCRLRVDLSREPGPECSLPPTDHQLCGTEVQVKP